MISDDDKRLFRDDLDLIMCKFSIDFPFWGVISERCKYSLTEADILPTAGMTADGHCIFNINFIKKLRSGNEYHKKLLFLITHELSHFAFEHMPRLEDRDGILWNISCDYAINLMLSYQFSDKRYFIEGGLLDEKYKDMYAEQIYDDLLSSGEKIDISIEDMIFGEFGDSDKFEGIRDRRVPLPDMEGKNKSQQREEIRSHIRAAFSEAYAVAKSQGKLPQEMDRILSKILKPRINWLRALRNKIRHGISRMEKRDITWSYPNRRFLDKGFVFPSNIGPDSPKICYAVDTSGSMSDSDLEQAMGELDDIRKKFNAKVYVLDCDANIHNSKWLNVYDPLPILNGGGGTDFRPVFDHIYEKRLKPDYVIFFTDGYGEFGEDRGLPVLWVLTSDVEVPFGETIRINVPFEG